MAHEGHDHGAAHAHGPRGFGRAFAIGIGLNLTFVVVEVVYGFLSNSMALLGDAGHNLSDVLGLVVAWLGMVFARRKPSKRHTYGLRRASILAAVFNAVSLVAVTGAVAWESLQRLWSPEKVAGREVIVVAAVGVVVNGVAAWLFSAGRKDDVNIHAAFLHLASDAAASLGVAVAGAAILFTGWMWLDPAVSLVLSVLVLVGTWSLLKRSTLLALDAVPEHIDLPAVEAYFAGLPGVTEFHDLHVWPMSTTETLLTVHLVVREHVPETFMADVCHELERRFRIGHATVQVEPVAAGEICHLKSHSTV